MAWLAACKDATAPMPAASVMLTPPTVSLPALGDTVRLAATAADANGSPVTVSQFTWTSSAPEIAKVAPDGLVTAVSTGVATISAETDGVSGDAEVTVSQKVSNLTVAPSSAALESLGDTIRLLAAVSDANDNPVGGASYAWTSSDPDVATVDAEGLVTALSDGTTEISVQAGDVAATADITVDQVATALVVTPVSVNLSSLDDTLRLSGVGTDAGGSTVQNLTISWSTSSMDIALIDDQGLLKGVGNGSATITADADAASTAIDVVVEQQVASIDVSPASPEMIVTDFLPLVTTPRDANGFMVPDAAIAFSSEDPDIANVDLAGRVTALAKGATTINASSGDVVAPIDVSVSGTVVGGTVATDTTWYVAGSPFVVTSNILVAQGAKLTVAPDVDVLFKAGMSLQVDGTLAAIGAFSDSIRFTTFDRVSPQPGDWGVVRFTDTSIDGTLSLGGDFAGGSGMSFVEISYGSSVQFDRSSPYFEWNHVHHLAGASPVGWPKGAIWACLSGSAIRFSVIENNSASGVVTLGGPMVLEDNQIGDNAGDWGGGVFAGPADCAGAGTAGDPVIVLNTISGNVAHTGGGIHVGDSDATIQGNRFWDNVATDTVTIFGGGSAISVARGAPDITDNELDGNSGFLGVPSSAILLQTSFGGVIQNNNLVDSTTYEIFLASVTTGPIDASSNWWGTTDTSVIDARIFDFSDDIDLASVEYEPFLLSPR